MFKKNKKSNKLKNAKVKFVKGESQFKFSEELINKNVSSLWRQSSEKLEVQRIIEFLELSTKKEEFVELKNVTIAKIILEETLCDEKLEILHKVSEKWMNRSKIVIFSLNDQQQFFIFWKTKEFNNFLSLKIFDDEPLNIDADLKKFIIEFLIISLDNDHSGLHRCYSSSYGRKQVELHFLADSRDFNLLFIASEQGYANVVKCLLDLGISSEIPGVDINPQILAWKNRHFDVLLALLHANLTYPPVFNENDCSEELKDFVEITEKFHESIVEENVDEIKRIIQLYPNLRYFYNTKNESASKIALSNNLIDIYVILITNKIFLGPYEDTEEIMKNLDYEDRRTIREIHFKELQDLPDKHINILVANSFVGHDSHDVKKKLNLVIHTFGILNKIPGIREVLIVTAASKKFCIIFDFNRDSVQLMDPTVGSETAGLFYLSGRIYIGAKQLLDPQTEKYGFATLAHELSHYAMYLTYHNDANPYNKKDSKTLNEVEKISILCEQQKEKEDVILMVYAMYQKDQQHAELIVRIPHLLALYHDNPEKLEELKVIYDKLFNLYEKKIVPEMLESVPEIESKIDKEIEKKDKKISKLKMFFMCFIVFGVIVAGLLGLLAYSLYTPDYKFNELTESQKNLVRNSPVNYNNITLKLSDLFSNNEDAYNNLTSTQIDQMIKEKTLNLNDHNLSYLQEFIRFKWENLTLPLKDKILNSNIWFQNEKLGLNILYKECSAIFSYLNSTQLKEILDERNFIIGNMVKNDTKFSVERKFIYEDMAAIHSIYITKNSNQTFECFLENLLVKHKDNFIREIQEFKNTLRKIDPIDYNDSHIKYFFKNFNEIIDETEKTRFFILSSEAGSGKTFTFKELAFIIKKRFPTRWITFITLKDCVKVYGGMKNNIESLDEIKILLQKLSKVDSNNEFELQLFNEIFKSGKMVLIWDGFDEVFPEYDKFTINIIKFIKMNTTIIQYISTRTVYSTVLREHFNTISYELVPLDKQMQYEFLSKLLSFKYVNESIIYEKIQQITDIFEPIVSGNTIMYKSSREINTPLMLVLTSEICDELDSNTNKNIFYVFNKFIQKKLAKGFEEKSSKAPIISSGLFNLAQYHQKFALKEIFRFFIHIFKLKLNKLKVAKQNLPKEIDYNDISQIGILHLTGENEYEFSHKSLAEYFFAQYLVENIYETTDNDNQDLSLRLEMFFSYLLSTNQRADYITYFLDQFLRDPDKDGQKSFNYPILKLMKTKFRNRFLKLMKQSDVNLVKFTLDFFKKDHILIVDLLGINKKETFYTSLYKPKYISCIDKPSIIKSIIHEYLSDNETFKFLNGVDQKGVIQFGTFFCHKLEKPNFSVEPISDKNFLNHTSFISFFDELSLTLNQNEQIELYKSAIDPTIYFIDLFNSEIFTNFTMSDYEYIWETLQNLTNNNSSILITVLGDSIAKCLDTEPEVFNTEELLPFFLNKTEELLSKNQIFEIFMNKKLLFRAVRQLWQFKVLWEFFEQNFNVEQKREILKNVYDKENEENGCNYLVFYHHIFEYCFENFKIFQFALLMEHQTTFNYVVKIYKAYLSEKDLQEIAISTIDIFLYMIMYETNEACCHFALYLQQLFKKNYDTLHTFLTEEIWQESIDVVEYFKSDRLVQQINAFEDLKNITGNLVNSTSNYCENVLKNYDPNDTEIVVGKRKKFENPWLSEEKAYTLWKILKIPKKFKK